MNPRIILPFLIAPFLAAHAVAADSVTLAQQGWQLWRTGKPAAAIEKFKQATELVPQDANAWNGLGWASFNSGHAEDAEKAFEKVIALNPNHAAALNGLGQIYLSRRDYAKAEPVLLKAAEQRAPAAWFGLARTYLLTAKFADAEKWLQMIEDSGQADAVVKNLLEAAKARELSETLRQVIEPPVLPVK